MPKARPQGQRPSSAAAPPSRHRSIVEEAIQFARSSRGSPAAPSKDMATSPKDFLNKQSKSTEGQRRRQQRMEKDFGPSPTNAQTTQMSSPRMDSEQSMVVTPDEKSPNSAKDLSNVRLEPSPIGGSPDDFENLRRATGSGPSAISPINSQQSAQIVQAPAATVQSSEVTPGCYLVYLSDSGGKLVLHYSKTPVESAIGFWRAGQGKLIQGFKYRQNSGRVELIKGIAGGDANKRKFFSGWCQFIKAAAAFGSAFGSASVPVAWCAASARSAARAAGRWKVLISRAAGVAGAHFVHLFKKENLSYTLTTTVYFGATRVSNRNFLSFAPSPSSCRMKDDLRP